MEKEVKYEGGCGFSLYCLPLVIVLVLCCVIDIPVSLVLILVIVGAVIWILASLNDHKNTEEMKKSMGSQYTLNEERNNICRRIFDDEVDISRFGDLDFIRILTKDGYQFVWSYDKETEYFDIEVLLRPGNANSVKDAFQVMVDELHENAGTENFTSNIADSVSDDYYLKFIEGLTYIKLRLEYPKDFGTENMAHVVSRIKSFGRGIKRSFSHREFVVNRSFYYTFHGLALENVEHKQVFGHGRSKSDNYKLQSLFKFITDYEHDEDYDITSFKDV